MKAPLQHKSQVRGLGQGDDPFGWISRRAFCGWFILGLASRTLAQGPDALQSWRRPASIAVLSTGHNDPQTYTALDSQLAAQLAGLGAGYRVTRREAGFSNERLLELAHELLSLRPDVLICLDLTAAVAAAPARTGNVPPIVFLAHDDPLAYHLIQSYAHPGNNLTGVTTFRCVDGKMVEILAEAFPTRKTFGYLLDSSVDDNSCIRLANQAAAPLGIRLVPVDVAAADFFEKGPATLAALKLDAVLAPASAPIWQNRQATVGMLNDLRLPAIFEHELFLKEGGLMHYGPVRTDAISQVVADTRKILQGEVAGDLPVDQPTRFELVVNLQAPHAADYRISPSVLRRADRILQ